jgi:threonine synthase
LATAHPAKFADAVLSAIPDLTEDDVISSAGPAIAEQLRVLKSLPSRAIQYTKGEDWIEDWTAKLRIVIESISAKRK